MRKPVGVNNSFHSSLLWRVAHFSRRYNSSSFNVDPKTTRVRHFSRLSRSGPSQLSTSSLPEGIPRENIAASGEARTVRICSTLALEQFSQLTSSSGLARSKSTIEKFLKMKIYPSRKALSPSANSLAPQQILKSAFPLVLNRVLGASRMD